ncbi:hypothetical protein A0U40_03820 [[Bacillus] sp. KCTC 13219]|nr:hypothetical protein A0U40_03820 [[Bacillus] sp. KCTC 13219]
MNLSRFLRQVTSFIHSRLQNSMLDNKKAERLAKQHIGNPLTLGRELGQVHKPKMDWLMLGLGIYRRKSYIFCS